MNHMNRQVFRIALIAVFLLTMTSAGLKVHADDADHIRPYSKNPFYWQYKGKPVLLLGGSGQDNLFNHPSGLDPGDTLEKHLDILKSVGGNYIRNTMSSRNPGNPWAFKRLENGLYDLNQWNQEYWNRLENLLQLCKERDIIVQIEIWDPWDYFKTEAPLGYGPENVGWESCPFNPALNVNYTAAESGLAETIDYYSGSKPSDHLFFHTPPVLKDVPLVRKYQEAFVEKLLSISLAYPNVLYCMNNEIGEPPEWGQYWARFIRARAGKAGKQVFLTDMRRNSNFESDEQVNLLHDRKHYDYFEISQNNANNDQQHYDHIIHIRSQVAEKPIPINNVKIYGGKIGRWTTSVEEGTRRFWRNIFGGCASSRFHRPGPSPQYFAIGLSDLARTHIRSMRMLTDAMAIFSCEPENDLLSERESNEAYCLAETGKQYAVYFPDGGAVDLDLTGAKGTFSLRWMNILESQWSTEETVQGGGYLELKPPARGQWAAVLLAASEETGGATGSHIRPFKQNPHYLAWDGIPIFPLGATNYHSWTPISRPENYDIQEELGRLAAVINGIGSPHVYGFVRCLPYDPMNHMHDGEVKEVLQPWLKLEDGRYDLSRFAPAWENRLREYLATALQHRIVVSLEIWDDWSITRGPDGAYDPGEGAAWNAHPFHPENNINFHESVLPSTTDRCNAPFYSTIPSRKHIRQVLDLQKNYVDRVLSIASEFPNILINISNESRAHLDWSRFWAEYIRQQVHSDLMIGEMPSTNRKDGGGECAHEFSPLTLCTDNRYDYVDIAQGVSSHEFNTPQRQALEGSQRIHQYYRAMAEAGTIRPLVTSKDYTRTPDGGDMVLWSRFIGGAAASRFHRPAGDHPKSVSRFQHEAIGRLGTFIADVPFWKMSPHPDRIEKLPDNAGANVLAEPDGDCVVQLIGGAAGESLQLHMSAGTWNVRWLDPTTSRELARSVVDIRGEKVLELNIPDGPEHRILHLEKETLIKAK